MISWKRIGWIVFFCYLCVFSLIQSALVISISKELLTMFFEVLIPSLFFLMVVLKIMEQSGILRALSKWLFGWLAMFIKSDEEELPYLFSGIFLGFAANALIIKDAYHHSNLSKESALRILYSIHSPTITFCVITCGTLLFDIRYGFLLFAIQSIVSLLCYRFLYTSTKIHHQTIYKPVFACIKDALLSTGLGLYQMAGYMLLSSIILSFLLLYAPQPLHLPLYAITEFASSSVKVCNLAIPVINKLLILSFIFGFGGICGHLQVFTFAEELRPNYITYASLRVLQAIVSALLMGVFIYIFL